MASVPTSSGILVFLNMASSSFFRRLTQMPLGFSSSNYQSTEVYHSVLCCVCTCMCDANVRAIMCVHACVHMSVHVLVHVFVHVCVHV